MYDYIIIGGGIVGLSVGMELLIQHPQIKLAIIEKESHVAAHQTGHNSGVIHSGIYYKPGSEKARLAKKGSQTMRSFCEEYGLEVDICGKVIVASEDEELPLLDNLYKRGIDNGLDIRLIDKSELLEIEPYVNGKQAIHVPMAGIVNYKQVSEKMAEIIIEKGGELLFNHEVLSVTETEGEAVISTNKGDIKCAFYINCGGLHSDRVAKRANLLTDMKIIPFRGEYYQLKEEKRGLVKNLIYPVPNPNFPFLGVHFTRMIGGAVDVGPNAVLGFKREGYRKTDIHLPDLVEVLGYKGFWKLASQYMKEGMDEMIRSASKKLFLKNVQKLMPEIQADDLIPGPAGVRAQALKDDGSLVDDFYILPSKRSIHVLNAPSPAATASIEIGKQIVTQMDQK
ncbi:(S)-2-hydroxyglutarate dehydrogenase [Cytobacillus horneckiae]|uniref:L-2-hydroxyglutarate oxidase n=1 Tax=Cytobacillus horneckiae TaxID=549687 RepID=A0A2N0ZEJ6_9BACI|nr:L-2-hydroxyglutarate oxidase [Cytobacillus horneckiae]MBN6888105.1 L-2-hydroxyglutarate oxidase [Cytobacillus horneckiae]MCM3176960.1 L-2-hydroxyglutarate oxidase [Cytobacillus horneckiae]MEC1154660.1 L-2-hydroxyglutarate oxidase [Cytobacillus horneckiae]MED2939001.1 L-2-hydroxyglutarate oxidase [Cytobacillus horneckiae]PKG27922.1 L-2-hydroxyglutarate oxidase [Cytobacillus horneckiae]